MQSKFLTLVTIMPLLFTNHLPPLIFIIIFILHESPPCIPTRSTPAFTLKRTDSFLNSQRGSHVISISQLKQYFRRFGYLPEKDYNVSDHISEFDGSLESSIIRYQSKLGLPITGKLDFDTLSQIMAPRCGVPDLDTEARTLHSTKDYALFPGKPRWARRIPMKLTYAFSKENVINNLNISDIKPVFKSAFSKWASVIPVSFVVTDDYDFADIRIGFYSGDHGDGEPFDGVLGVLAHSFSPESGKFHLDAAETWAVDFATEKSPVAVDLESVVLHEIGHLLGLAHSPVKDAVMYPTLKPRDKKVDLALDDVQGVQALYGSNPNFTIGSLLEYDISTNQGVDLRIRAYTWTALTLNLVICFHLHMIA